MAAAAHGQHQLVVAGEVHGGGDVGRTSAANDRCRIAVDHPVPYVSRRIEAILAWTEHATPDGFREGQHCLFVYRRSAGRNGWMILFDSHGWSPLSSL
jgi:hypothetical protein